MEPATLLIAGPDGASHNAPPPLPPLARKCWRVYYGDFGTIAAASIALNLRGKFSDCGK
jgi:hypothetical protein